MSLHVDYHPSPPSIMALGEGKLDWEVDLDRIARPELIVFVDIRYNNTYFI